MNGEWVRYVENYVADLRTEVGLEEQAARILLQDCQDHNELSHYQAHQVLMGFLDNRGFS